MVITFSAIIFNYKSARGHWNEMIREKASLITVVVGKFFFVYINFYVFYSCYHMQILRD